MNEIPETPDAPPQRPRPLRRRLLVAGLLLAAALAGAPPLQAHLVNRGLGTAVVVRFDTEKVALTFDLGFGAVYARNAMMRIDEDRDFRVSEAEAQEFLETSWKELVEPALRVRLNGETRRVRRVSSHAENLVGEIATLPFDLYYELEVEIPYASAEDRRRRVELEVLNRVVKDEATDPPFYYLPFSGHAVEVSFEILAPTPMLDLQSYIMQDEKLIVAFDMAQGERLDGPARLLPESAPPPEVAASAPPPLLGDEAATRGATADAADAAARAASDTGGGDGVTTEPPGAAPRDLVKGPAGRAPAGVEEDHADAFLEQAVQESHLGFWQALGFLALAFLYGMGHALTPGHGKSMVAAYLVGTRGRIRDAVALGVVTTVTHTSSVFLLGLILHLAVRGTTEQQTVQNWAIVTYSLLGSALLLGMGLILFQRRVRWFGRPELMLHAGESHSHGWFGHSHGPGRGHGAPHAPAPAGAAHAHAHEHEHEHEHEHHHAHDPAHHERQHSHAHAVDHEPDAPAPPEPPVSETQDRDPEAHTAVGSAADDVRGEELPAAGAPRARAWELISLGVAGGIVPCPGGLTVLAIGLLYPKRLVFALLLLTLFSLGLGAVLVAIGVLLVTGQKVLLARSRARERLFSYLPALSALFLASLGSFYLVRTFLLYRPEIASMLDAAAGWVRGF